jgi:LysM repeat protein
MKIAKQHGVLIDDLAHYNHITNRDTLQVGQKIKIPKQNTGPKQYKVQKGDSIDRIAKKFGVVPKSLIAYNNLKNPDRLSIGQVMKIPTGAKAKFTLPSYVRQQLAKTKIHSSKWKYIVVHHSASERGTMKGIDEYHRVKRRMENGLAYHFVIGNGRGMGDGEIGIGNRWKRQIRGGHLASESLNEKSIGICLIGNFEKTHVTKKQTAAVKALLQHLLANCRLSTRQIQTHRAINTKPTICPGKHFNLATLTSGL